MASSDDWYRRFFGEEYLLFDEHLETVEEVAFIRTTLGLRSGMRLLDLCCGYGRHSNPLAELGVKVIGLDLSPVLLREALDRRWREDRPRGGGPARLRKGDGKGRKSTVRARTSPHWVRGDIRLLPLSRRFDAVISMFTSIGYFEDEAENFAVLKGVAGVLVPGGRFLMETVNRDAIVRHFQPVQVYRPKGLTVVEERQFDLVSGRSRVDVTVIRGGKETRLHHSIRVYTFTEIEMLLLACGLEVEGVWGDFKGGTYTWNAASMIVMARKKAGSGGGMR